MNLNKSDIQLVREKKTLNTQSEKTIASAEIESLTADFLAQGKLVEVVTGFIRSADEASIAESMQRLSLSAEGVVAQRARRQKGTKGATMARLEREPLKKSFSALA